MKKPSASKKSLSTAKTKPDSLSGLLTEVRQLIQSARRGVATVVDTFQVMTNFEIGRRIVEHEQKGAKRAAYGAELLKELSARLTEEFGRGFSRSNLQNMRSFFLLWEDRVPKICQQPIGKLVEAEISQQPVAKSGTSRIFQTVSEKSGGTAKIRQQAIGKFDANEISQQAAGKLVPIKKGQSVTDQMTIFQTPSGKSRSPFTLSWTHYLVLLTIKEPDERSFYEIEATNAGWSVPELKRQKASCLYERLALSRDKAGIRKLAKEGQVIVRPEDLLKEPLVLEFLGLEEKSGYSENDLEQAIIDRLEHFLLELGKGFLFEARQKRFTFDEDHYFVDSCPVRYQLRQPKSETNAYLTGSIFYNRLLRCYVIIDLHPVRYPHQSRIAHRTPLSHGVKLDKLTHQDLGQMQIYPVRYEHALRLCPSKPRRRQFLRRLHQRSQAALWRASRRQGAIYQAAAACGTRILRSVSNSRGRHEAREIPQNRLGQALHQVASRRLSHGAGVNYYDREVKLPEENPTIGLLLCKSAKKTVVELTLPKDANIHAKEYQLYLPTKELLKQKLDEWSAAASR